MTIKRFISTALVVALASTVANAEEPEGSGFGPSKGDWEFTLSGSGTNDNDFDSGGFALTGSIGYYLTENWLLLFRQSAGFSDFGDSSWNGASRVAIDYVFDFDEFRPYIGANLGGFYGDDTEDTGAAGLEAGLKWYVKPETFLYVTLEYQFLFDGAESVDEGFDDGVFLYGVGIGFNF